MDSATENQAGHPVATLRAAANMCAADSRKALGPQAAFEAAGIAQGGSHVTNEHPATHRPQRVDRRHAKQPQRIGPSILRQHETQTQWP